MNFRAVNEANALSFLSRDCFTYWRPHSSRQRTPPARATASQPITVRSFEKCARHVRRPRTVRLEAWYCCCQERAK
eukprot:1346131-Prymnesium_polylepis.1